MVLTILCGVLALGAVALLILLFAEKKRSSGFAVDRARRVRLTCAAGQTDCSCNRQDDAGTG